MRSVYFCTGMLSNYRGLLPAAVETGRRYGFEVKILDIIDLVPAWKPYPNPWDTLGLATRVVRPGSEAALRSLAKQMQPSDLVVFLNLPDKALRWIWRILDRGGCQVGVMTLSPLPLAPVAPARGAASRWRNALARRVKALVKPSPGFWIIAGRKSVDTFRNFFLSLGRTRIIEGHSIDFETMLRNAPPDERPESRYILFLDQGWHAKPRPHFMTPKEYPPTDRERYAASMARLLQRLSDETGKPVLVSVHPKADPEISAALYRGFTIARESAAELVHAASLVVGHCSTSLQYAVIANKPILLVTSDELDHSIMRSGLQGYQAFLDAPMVNMDHPDALPPGWTRPTVNEHRYTEFMRDYVIARAGDRTPLWDKVFAGLAQVA